MSLHADPTRPRQRNRRGRGDELRPDIVKAARDLLAVSADSTAVSIRAVADAVGVTSPSIYLHFADKDALIQAVVADVFADLDDAMAKAGAAETNPLSRMRAYGLAYVRFAVAHPEHYRIAVMDRCPDDGQQGGTHLDEILNDSAFSRMLDTVRDCMTVGIFTDADPVPVALQMWAAAHGIAALVIAKPFLPWGDVDAMADAVLCSAAIGRAVNDRLDGKVNPSDVLALLGPLSSAGT